MDGGGGLGRGGRKGVLCDEVFPLSQGRHKDGFFESEVRAAEVRNYFDECAASRSAANDSIAAVDVSGDVLEAGFGESFAQRFSGQLRFAADAAEEQEIHGFWH